MAALQTTEYRNARAIGLLVFFLVLVLGVGSTIGVLTAPSDWFASLAKPPFNPPNWVFAPVWFTLYVLIALAGWRTFLQAPTSPQMWLWAGQMALNWLWSPTWFTLHLLWPAFVVLVLMLVLGFIAVSWRRDRVASGLFIPYAAWVVFAGLLNFSIALLNP